MGAGLDRDVDVGVLPRSLWSHGPAPLPVSCVSRFVRQKAALSGAGEGAELPPSVGFGPQARCLLRCLSEPCVAGSGGLSSPLGNLARASATAICSAPALGKHEENGRRAEGPVCGDGGAQEAEASVNFHVSF